MKNNFPLSGFSSVALHAANNSNNAYAHSTPIYATSTFVFDNAQQGMERFESEDKEKIYSRWSNPTFKVAEETIAAFEAFNIKTNNGNTIQLKALLHASGQAAMTTMFLSCLQVGDTVLSHYSLYGGTYELMYKVLRQAGINIEIVNFKNLNEVEDRIKQNKTIKFIHIETPANPTIQCVDIEAISTLAKQFNIKVSVDNTFATPYLQQPFQFGVDFVLHSTTKFLNGHGTSIGGVLLGSDIDFMKQKVWKWFALLGGNANAFDAFMLINGMKTLELRMERHCSNAKQVASFMQQHHAIAQVNYNGLESHVDYALTLKQMKHAGALLSFELKGGIESGKKFIDNLKMCTRAVSLGTVDTLVSHPASMTHYSVPKEERIKFGITDGLIRVSIGIENVEDILNDFDQALHSV
ncbi:MAG TPA: aminotransferase class I/II-fold pyridoxal phosphate-dependent enzyme [Chitinophagaceae bacterium]|nr:aminotransferase class I/II-fold pyridoxal phosphate-dependent enzyme [Chitinophagaceae bacterium]HMZ46704.1 aminotransferase class I/II-fold pyridoxal phosphate-dependent enzyme [Chitinophagaceae bacterium]HNE93496.1 aminotransferase class I/II-fold pyridoxal phosphate-dependent enzyme [Chitinophagaceae bacterium]HNF29282.1 aminotransferase class I/II-fold pyridoxal phosphate-dependent enzyme [Chitinophagaceae bacterium]HNJ57679.1 aminotransferase class I/II-fold pyridoxal phosphate-depende